MTANKRICIFCRLPKEKFKEEHVFPAAIGGAFVLLNVCEECNTELGNNIDEPFTKNRIVLFYRKLFDIKRKDALGERTITNPFKGTDHHVDKGGNKYYISFNEDKKEFIATLVRQYERPLIEGGGWIGKMTLPIKDFTSEEDIIKQYAKKFGLNPSKIGSIIKERNPEKEIKIKLSDSNKTLILGCLKIAYEFTMTFIPEYWDDPYSKIFSNILITNIIREEEKEYFDYDFSIREEFIKRISEIKDLKTFHHVALLKTIKGSGLYCAVKIFDWVYAIHLSKRENYLLSEELLILNDSIRQAYWIDIPTKITNFNIFLDLAILNPKHRRIIESSNGVGYTAVNGMFPIFERNGKLVCNHIEELANAIQIVPEYYDHLNKQIVVPVTYEAGKYYVKFFKDDFLIPLQQVNFIYSLLY